MERRNVCKVFGESSETLRKCVFPQNVHTRMLGNITTFFVVPRANTHHNVTAFEVYENGFNNKLNMSKTDHNFSIILK